MEVRMTGSGGEEMERSGKWLGGGGPWFPSHTSYIRAIALLHSDSCLIVQFASSLSLRASLH